jgi:hypothetical protein
VDVVSSIPGAHHPANLFPVDSELLGNRDAICSKPECRGRLLRVCITTFIDNDIKMAVFTEECSSTEAGDSATYNSDAQFAWRGAVGEHIVGAGLVVGPNQLEVTGQLVGLLSNQKCIGIKRSKYFSEVLRSDRFV